MISILQLLALVLVISENLALAPWLPNFQNVAKNQESPPEDYDINYIDGNLDYLEGDVYIENEHKADLLSGVPQRPPLDDYEEIRDKKLNTARCEEVKNGPYSLEIPGFHVLPTHYHNISCKRTYKDHVILHTDNRNMLIHFCKARYSECITMEKEISVFRKQVGRPCWIRDSRIIQVGCKCS